MDGEEDLAVRPAATATDNPTSNHGQSQQPAPARSSLRFVEGHSEKPEDPRETERYDEGDHSTGEKRKQMEIENQLKAMRSEVGSPFLSGVSLYLRRQQNSERIVRRQPVRRAGSDTVRPCNQVVIIAIHAALTTDP